MSKKLYEVRHIGYVKNVTVKEIKIEKESEKQYVISGTSWTRLSKADLDCYIGSRNAVYSHDRQKAIDIYTEKMEEMKHDLLQRVEDVIQGLKKLQKDSVTEKPKKKKKLKNRGWCNEKIKDVVSWSIIISSSTFYSSTNYVHRFLLQGMK